MTIRIIATGVTGGDGHGARFWSNGLHFALRNQAYVFAKIWIIFQVIKKKDPTRAGTTKTKKQAVQNLLPKVKQAKISAGPCCIKIEVTNDCQVGEPASSFRDQLCDSWNKCSASSQALGQGLICQLKNLVNHNGSGKGSSYAHYSSPNVHFPAISQSMFSIYLIVWLDGKQLISRMFIFFHEPVIRCKQLRQKNKQMRLRNHIFK